MKRTILLCMIIMFSLIGSVLADIGETEEAVIFFEDIWSFQVITFGGQTCGDKQGSCYTKVDGTSYVLINCVAGTMSDGRAKCTCDYGASCNPSGSVCAGGSVRCSGTMRQFCDNSGRWVDAGACPSGTSCYQVSTSAVECRGTTIAVCTSDTYRCSGQKQQLCSNGQWVDLGVTCPSDTTCQSGGYKVASTCKPNTELKDLCTYNVGCGSGQECIKTNVGNRCMSCTSDNNCVTGCANDPDCTYSGTTPTTPPSTGSSDPVVTDTAGIYGFPYWLILIIVVIIIGIAVIWKVK